MNWKKIAGIMVGIALIALMVFKLRTNKNETEKKVYQYNKEQAVSVQTDTIRIKNIEDELSYTGTFEPYKESKISADVQGRINAVLVDAGSPVVKGQTLIQLDNSLLKLQIQSAEVQIEALEADVKRYTILVQADAIQGVQLEKAVTGLNAAKIQKSILSEQISKTTIKAPFSGIVTAKLSEVGAFAAPGVPLLQITSISLLKFTVNVPENDLKLFRNAHDYRITADAYSDIPLSGKNVIIGSKANMGNSFPVQFTVNNTTDLTIKSGMFGKVVLKSGEQQKGILIPASAITGSSAEPKVYLVKNGKAVLQNLTVSGKTQNRAIISNGLNPGDVIVTNGLINLFEGANIVVK